MALLRNPRGCCRHFLIAALAGTVLSFGAFAGLSRSYGQDSTYSDYTDTNIYNNGNLIVTDSIDTTIGSIVNTNAGLIADSLTPSTTSGPTITAKTSIENNGTMYGSTITATNDLKNGGTMNASVSVNAGTNVYNGATMTTGGSVNADTYVDNDGTMTADSVEAGTYVDNDGTMTAASVTARNANVENTGNLSATGTVHAGQDVNNDTTMTADVVDADRDVNNDGTMTANSVDAVRDVNNNKEMIVETSVNAGNDINNAANATISNAEGTTAGPDLIAGNNINNRGDITGKDLTGDQNVFNYDNANMVAATVSANEFNVENLGYLNATGAVSAKVDVINGLSDPSNPSNDIEGIFTAGSVAAGQNFLNAAGRVEVLGTTGAGNNIDNYDKMILNGATTAGGSITNHEFAEMITRGTVDAVGNVTNQGNWQGFDSISGANVTNNRYLNVTGDVNATAGSVTNNESAEFMATGTVSATENVVNNGAVFTAGNIDAVAAVENNAGIMTTGGIAGQTLTNSAVLKSTGVVAVTETIMNDAGNWTADGTVTGANIINDGVITGSADFTVGEDVINLNVMETTGTISATSDVINDGMRMNAGNIAADDEVVNNTGEMNVTNTLTAGNTLVNNEGATLAARNIAVTNDAANGGTMSVADSFTAASIANGENATMNTHGVVSAADVITNEGQWNATGDIVGGSIANIGALNSEADVIATGEDVDGTSAINNTGGLTATNVTAEYGSITNEDNAFMSVTGVVNSGTDITNNGILLSESVIADGTLTNNEDATLDTSLVRATDVVNNSAQVETGTGVGFHADSIEAANSVSNNGTMMVAGQIMAGAGGVSNDAVMVTESVATTGAVENTNAMSVNGAVSATGALTNSGNLNAAGQISAASVTNEAGELYAGSMDTRAVDNAAIMKVNGELAAVDVANTGNLVAGSMAVQALINGPGARVIVNGQISAVTVANAGTAEAGSIIATNSVANNAGTMTVNGQIMAGNGGVSNGVAAVPQVGASDATLTAGSIATTGNVSNNTAGSVMRVNGAVAAGGDLTNAGTFDAAGLVAVNSVTNTSDFYANSMNVNKAVNNNEGKMTVDNTFEAGSLSNNSTLTTNGLTKVNGDIANSGQWTANSVTGEGALNNSGNINLKGDMAIDDTIDNTGGTISGTSANASVSGANLTGGTLNRIKNLYVGDGDDANGNVNGGVVINMIGNNSTATVEGDFGGDGDGSSINNVGDLWIGGVTNTTGELKGAGNGSVLTFVGQLVNAGIISEFDDIYSASELAANVISLTGATDGAEAEFNGDLTAENGISRFNDFTVDGSLTTNAGGIVNVKNLTVGDGLTTQDIIARGEGSLYKVTGNVLADAITGVDDFETYASDTQKGDMTADSIVGTGEGSTYDIAGTLIGHQISEIESLTADIIINGEGDSITGTGSGSKLDARAIYGDDDESAQAGSITEYQFVTVGSDLGNAATGVFTGTGAGSVYQFKGALDNQGEITNVESFRIAGNVDNGDENDDAMIAGTGKDSIMTVGGNLNNYATVENYEDLLVSGFVYNDVEDTITGTGLGSMMTVDGENADGIGLDNQGTIQLYENIYVANDVVNGSADNHVAAINGTVSSSTMVVGGNLENNAVVQNYETLRISGYVHNNADALINGTWGGSMMTVDGEDEAGIGLLNNSVIEEYEKMFVANDVVNNGDITATGPDSHYKLGGNLNNQGEITEVESFRIAGNVDNGAENDAALITGTDKDSIMTVGGNLNNYATVENYEDLLVSGFVFNNAEDVIAGTGLGSIMTVDGADEAGIGLNNNGDILYYEKMYVANDVLNTAGGWIVGTGEGSLLTGDRNLSNDGVILDYESVIIGGNVDNTGVIGAGITGDRSDASFTVSGDLTNGIADGETLTAWTAESIGTDSLDSRDLHRTEYPAFQSIDLYDGANLKNIALVANYANMDVDGAVTNNANGYIMATGAGSVYNLGSLDNAGILNNVETLNFDGADDEDDVFQVATAVKTSNPQGDYNTYGAINGDVAADAGDFVNRSGGLVRGTGAGSTMNVSGNMYNMFGSTVRNFETINVAGSMANEGVLEFSKDVKIAGDFVNTLTYEEGSDATGGVLVTDLYNGRIAQVTVEGDATINGGELWIGNSGEQLAVGKDYNVITVKDGHLTVNDKLQVRALNEYDYDTMWEDNAADGFSSNSSASATPRLFHAEGFSTDTTYYVSLRRDYIYGDAGRTANQRNFGRYVDAIAYTLNSTDDNYEEGDLFNVLSALDNENIKAGNVPDSDYGYSTGEDGEYTYVSGVASEGALDALEQLSGSIYAEMGMMSMQNTWMVGQHLSNFLRPNFCLQCNQCNYGMISRCGCGDDSQESVIGKHGVGLGHNVWGMYYGSTGDVDSDGNSRGFYYHTNGFLVGADLFRNDVSRFGFYGAFGGSSISKDGMNQRVESDNYNFGVYGVHEFCLGNLMVNAAIGRDDYRAERYLSFGQLPAGGAYGNNNSNYVERWHRGDTESTQANIRMEQSWNYAIWNTVLQPFIAGSYTHMQVDGVNETTTQGDRADGQYVTELMSDDYELDSVRSELGLRLSRCLYKNCRTLNVHGHASWAHEFADTNATVTNSFTNKNYDTQETGYNNGYNTIANNAFNSNQYNVCSYSVSGVDLGSDYVWAGVGLTYDNLCNCATVFGGYDIFANNRQTLHNGTIGVQFDW